jgi:hypothetical protein
LPPAPQLIAVGGETQYEPGPRPAQQPLGQLTVSQMHWPVTQCWPAWQGLPVPHWHWPLTLQVSAPTPQSTQALAWMPQAPDVWWQLPPASQQPLVQVVMSQRQLPPAHWMPPLQAGAAPHVQPPLHVSAVAGSQATQATPPVPH